MGFRAQGVNGINAADKVAGGIRRREVLADLLQCGIDSGKLVENDRDLLLDLAHAAEQIDAPGRRGRGGLMTPSVTQLVEEPMRCLPARSVVTQPVLSRRFGRRPSAGIWRCEPSALGRQETLQALDGVGEGRQALVDRELDDLGIRCEVVVSEESRMPAMSLQGMSGSVAVSSGLIPLTASPISRSRIATASMTISTVIGPWRRWERIDVMAEAMSSRRSASGRLTVAASPSRRVSARAP